MSTNAQCETVKFRIPADPRYISTIRRAILSLARSLGFEEQIAEDIHLSVAEAITNAVEHGSPEHSTNTVSILCRISDNALSIEVRDEGTGFDMPDATCEASYEERGRGLKLIYNLMDNVKVRHTTKGSRIRMVKRNQKEPVGNASKL